MSAIDDLIAAWTAAFPRYVNAGIASSGPGKPNKLLVMELGQKIADAISAASGGDGTLAYATVADMNADLDHDANTQAAVYADSGGDTTNHNGIWTKVGASGTGSWTWLRALSIVELGVRLDALEAIDAENRLAALEDATDANAPALLAYLREMTERPGDAPGLFADAYTGTPDSSSETALTPATVSAGKVLQLSGAGIIARRGWFRVEPNRKYLVRAILSRATDPADPNNDAAELGVAWLKNDGTAVSGTPVSVVGTFSALTVASGRTQKQAIIATASGDGITNVAPATTIYARPYVQTYGGGGLTNVEVLEVKDVTDAIGDSIATDLVNDAIAAAADVATIETSVQTLHDDTLAAAASAGADLWSRPVDSTVSSEPGSPSDGDRVLLDETNATHPNQVAERISGSWVYSGTPKDGQPIWDQNAKLIRRYSSAAGAWFASNNQSVLLSWFVTAGGAYDYASADSFADSAGLELEIDVPFDVSGIGGSGVSFDSDISFGHAKITRGTKTVTFNGTVDRIRTNAFDAAGTGLVTFVRTPRLYVCDLGVEGDGSTDDANALAQAILSAKASKSVLFGNNSIVCNLTSQITIPPNIIFDADGLRLIPDATLTSGFLAIIDGTQAGYTGELRGEINGLHLLQALTSNHADTSKNVDGLQIGGSNGAYDIKINDLNVQGFRDLVVLAGSNVYVDDIYSPMIINGWRRGLSFTATTNSGEMISVFGGVIANVNNTAGDGAGVYFDGSATTPEFSFHGTRFDYSDISVDIRQGRINLVTPHLENNNNNPHIKLTNSSGKERCSLSISGGYMGNGPGSVSWTGTSTEDSTGRAAYVLTSGGGCSVDIRGTKCGTFNTTDQKTEIVKSGGSDRRIHVEPVLDAGTGSGSSAPLAICNAQNALWISTADLSTWTQNGSSGTTQSLDTSTVYSPDTSARKTVSASGNSSSLVSKLIPCRAGQTLVIKAYVDVTSISAGYVAIQAKFYAQDGTTQIGSTQECTHITATTSGYVAAWISMQVPNGASYLTLADYCSSFTGTAYFSNEHVWLY